MENDQPTRMPHPSEVDPVEVDLDALDADIESLEHLDPAEAAEPAARIAEVLSVALDEDIH